MIANLFFYETDVKIEELSKKYLCTYTRYADDLSFSSNNEFDYKKFVIELRKILNTKNLQLSSSKTIFSKFGQAQYVTGLSISDKKYPRIPKKIKKRLRQELYYIDKFGLTEHCASINENEEKTLKRLFGYMAYIYSIEPDVANYIKRKLVKAGILENESSKISYIF